MMIQFLDNFFENDQSQFDTFPFPSPFPNPFNFFYLQKPIDTDPRFHCISSNECNLIRNYSILFSFTYVININQYNKHINKQIRMRHNFNYFVMHLLLVLLPRPPPFHWDCARNGMIPWHLSLILIEKRKFNQFDYMAIKFYYGHKMQVHFSRIACSVPDIFSPWFSSIQFIRAPNEFTLDGYYYEL